MILTLQEIPRCFRVARHHRKRAREHGARRLEHLHLRHRACAIIREFFQQAVDPRPPVDPIRVGHVHGNARARERFRHRLARLAFFHPEVVPANRHRNFEALTPAQNFFRDFTRDRQLECVLLRRKTPAVRQERPPRTHAVIGVIAPIHHTHEIDPRHTIDRDILDRGQLL